MSRLYWYRKIIFLLFLNFFAFNLKSQFAQDTSKRIRYLLVPAIFNSPEFGFGYGLSGSMSFKTSFKGDTLTRTSVIQIVGLNTTRGVNAEAIDATIYFPKQRYVFLGQISHNYFPDKFWGIGPNTPDLKIPERYIYEHLYFHPHFKKRLSDKIFVGALYEFQNVFKLTYPDSGLFAKSNLISKKKYVVSGAGGSASYDSRDNVFWPEKGVFLSTQLLSFNRILGSDFNVLKWTMDFRFFKKLFKSNIFAFQFYNYRTYGNTPIRDLGALGGQGNLRGFYQGRYRAKSMFTCIAEYRYNFYKRLSAVFFGGLGTVYNLRKELVAENLKYSYGFGIRFALLEKERLNLRLDYGYSNKLNQGFYFTIGECF